MSITSNNQNHMELKLILKYKWYIIRYMLLHRMSIVGRSKTINVLQTFVMFSKHP